MPIRKTILAIGAILAFVLPAVAAQAPVSAADLSRLEATATDIESLAGALAKTDPTAAADVRASLKEANEEIAYLKVKLRREGRVAREEYGTLRDRLETLRIKAQGGKVSATPVMADDPARARPERAVTVAVGTEFDIRLQTPLNSGTAKVEQRFEGTTLEDVVVAGVTAIPAGAVARGFVSSVRPAGRLDRKGSLTLSFDELRIDQTTVRLRASVTKALDPKMRDDATRIGAGAVVGAVVGGILGGGKGALLGVIIGGGGTIAATEGTDVSLPVGTVLRIRVDQPIELIVR
jgi:hypothetical protein